MKRWMGVLLLALIVTPLFATRTQAAPRERCFAETGYCVSGAILDYWERNGGLPVFGYPITPLRTETIEGSWTGPTQWFERDRLEDHANEGKGVLAGRLGAHYLELTGRPWQRGNEPASIQRRCLKVPETGHNVCAPFNDAWQSGGIERFGYPLTDAFEEVIEGKPYLVQYFERRRMEYHPEQIGTPYVIQLGLLGRDVYARTGDGAVVQPTPGDLPAAIQQPILDTVWANVRKNIVNTAVTVALVDVAGDYAFALAVPQERPALSVYLKRHGTSWLVIDVNVALAADDLRKKGVPETLIGHSERFAVVIAAVAQMQDPRGAGLNGYITRPRIAGDYARFWVVPAAAAQRDPASTFYKRERRTWAFLTAGTAFPEDDLRTLGVPQELWPYGEIVRAPGV